MKIPATVGILTRNSEKTIGRALASVADFAEIIVCDGGSGDATLLIAEKSGAKIINQYAKFLKPDGAICDFSGVRNQCLDAATQPWFFYIDSDEAATPEIRYEIAKIIASNPEKLVYGACFELVLPDRVVRKSAALPSYQKRFFKISTGARFAKEVHEKIIYDEKKYKSGRLAGRWQVIWDEERVRRYWEKSQAYLELEVERSRKQTAGGFLRFSSANIFGAVKRLAKAIINIFAIPKSSRMPFSIEWLGIRYALKLVFLVSKDKLFHGNA